MSRMETERPGPAASSINPVVSVVLPARNEAAGIQRAIRAVDALLSESGMAYEIIVGDSACTDGTVALAIELGNPHVRVVRCDEPGKGRILTRALAAARGSAIGFIDSDLEISVDYLKPALIAVMLGADAAIGSKNMVPEQAARRPPFRRLITSVANRLIRFSLGTRLSDHQAGMKVFRRDALVPVLARVRATGWLWDTEVLALLQLTGGRIEEIAVETTANRPSRFGSVVQLSSAAIDLAALCARIRLRRWFSRSTLRHRSAGALYTAR